MNRLYTAKELAEILNVSPKTIRKSADRGEIESYRIGKAVRFVNPIESEKNKTNNKESFIER